MDRMVLLGAFLHMHLRVWVPFVMVQQLGFHKGAQKAHPGAGERRPFGLLSEAPAQLH